MSPRKPATPELVWSEKDHPVWLYRFLRSLTSPPIRFLFWTRREGRLPKKGAVILVSNHVSNLDPVLVVATMRRPIFHLGKHTLFKNRFGRWFFLTLGGQIPVDRGRGGNEAAIDAAMRVLDRGLAMGIYPEGRRSPDGRLCRGRTGVARLALRSGAPVYPVAIMGSMKLWPKGRKFPKFFRPTKVKVGPPRTYAKDPAGAEDPRRLREVTDEIMMDLAKVLGQTDYDPATAPLLSMADE